MMRIFFDTEFIEDGKTIDLISIGMVREDGKTYYAVSDECDHSRAGPWVRDNVLPHLTLASNRWKSREQIANEVYVFAGFDSEFWAYYAAYDWVALCQLFGTMMDLPEGWPMYCRDIKQLCDDLGDPRLPKQTSTEHNALADARWNAECYRFLKEVGI